MLTDSSEILLRPRRPEDDPAIVTAFNRVFAAIWGACYEPRTVAHFAWQYAPRDVGDRCMLACDARGEVLAFWGGMALRVETVFGPQVFVHSCDNFVVPEHRDTGLYVRLAQAAVARCSAVGDALGYGHPLPEAYRFDRRHLATLDLGEVDYLCLATAAELPVPPALRVERVHALDGRTDALWARVRPAYGCLTRRDAAYLTWRYLAAASFDYRVLAAWRHDELAGLAVLRPYHELRPGACALVDWLVPPDDSAACDALLAASLSVARAANRTTLLTSFAPCAPERAALLARGFVAVASRETLAHPLVYRALDPRLSPECLRQLWWMTLGDSDLG